MASVWLTLLSSPQCLEPLCTEQGINPGANEQGSRQQSSSPTPMSQLLHAIRTSEYSSRGLPCSSEQLDPPSACSSADFQAWGLLPEVQGDPIITSPQGEPCQSNAPPPSHHIPAWSAQLYLFVGRKASIRSNNRRVPAKYKGPGTL